MAILPGRGTKPWDVTLAAHLGVSHNPDGTLKQAALNATRHRAHDAIYVAAVDSPAWMKVIADYVCDGVADNVQWQAAINEAQTYVTALGAAPVVALLPGNFHLSSQVTLKSAPLVGMGAAESSVRVLWDGSSIGTALSKSTDQGGTSFGCLRNIAFHAGTAEPACWINLDNADNIVDVLFRLSELQFNGGARQIRVGGWVNLHWEHLRFDDWSDYAVYAEPDTVQYLSSWVLDKWTADSRSTSAKAFLGVNCPASGTNPGIITLANGRVELNAQMTAPNALVHMINDVSPTADMPRIKLENLAVDYASTYALDSLVHITSTTSSFLSVDLQLRDCMFKPDPGFQFHGGDVFSQVPNFAVPASVPNYLSAGASAFVRSGIDFRMQGMDGQWIVRSGSHDNFPAYRLQANGLHEWATDTNLYRAGSNLLATDDAFRVATFTTAGRPSAATVGAGTMIFDTTLGKPVWSNGSVWKDAAGTTV